jgi:hypothetical protein
MHMESQEFGHWVVSHILMVGLLKVSMGVLTKVASSIESSSQLLNFYHRLRPSLISL